MPTTNFSSGTVISSTWLNEVDAHVYENRDYTGNFAYSTDSQWGLVGDGSDETTAIQAFIDANKGKHIVFNGDYVYGIGGIELDGATYDGTVIECLGNTEFKLLADGGASTFGGAWVGILIKDCTRVQLLNVKFNGNKSAMTATREQIFCVGIAGATDWDIRGFRCREIQGDGIFISQSNWTSNSTTPKRGVISDCRGYNATTSGRDLISVISCEGLQIHGVYSYQIGGVINGTTMPGGVNIEPDQSYHTCSDIQIADAMIISAGSSGIGVFGKAVTNDATRDWNCSRISVKDVQVKLVSSAVGGPAFSRISFLQLDVKVEQVSGTAVKGIVIDGCDNVTGEVTSYGNNYGVNIGPSVEVQDISLDVAVSGYTVAGLRTTKINGGKFTGRIYGATSASSTFAIQCHNEGGSATQTNVAYSVDCPFDGNNQRALRNEIGSEVTFSNSRILNCDFSGYSSIATMIDAQLPASNVVGLTNDALTASFSAGDTTPSVGIGAKFFICANVAPTSVTMFDDGYDGREFVLRLDSNTTIVHNASNIRLSGAANITGRTSDDHVSFRRISGIWFEQTRSW